MSNQAAIRALIAQYAPKDIPVGTDLTLPDRQQTYRLIATTFRRVASGKTRLLYVWDGPCAVCGEGFEQMTSTRMTGIVRTCPAHRGSITPVPRAPKPRKPRATKGKRVGGVQAVALVVAAEQALVRPGMPAYALADLVTKRLPAPVAGARDTRLQVAVRALRLLAKRPDVPFVEADGWFMFDGHDLV